MVGESEHFVPSGRKRSHVCLIFNPEGNFKAIVNGMAWGWYTGASTDGTQIDIGGFPANPFEGTVEELSLNSNAQDPVLLLAQSQGNVCNSGEDDMFIDISGYDYRKFIKLTFMINHLRHKQTIKNKIGILLCLIVRPTEFIET